MKRVILTLGILFLFACSKTEVPATQTIAKEETIKFTTSADTLTLSNNIIDTLPLSINVSSILPPSGLIYSIQVVKNDNSQVVYKLDTTLSLTSLVLQIPGFSNAAQYNLSVTVTSKKTSSNTLSKTITLNRFNIKEFISANSFLNNKPIVDWTKPSGNNSFKWWDMDGDAKPDKIY
jgi:PBP1b-binding outer membrane lipoprotein LpoB